MAEEDAIIEAETLAARMSEAGVAHGGVDVMDPFAQDALGEVIGQDILGMEDSDPLDAILEFGGGTEDLFAGVEDPAAGAAPHDGATGPRTAQRVEQTDSAGADRG